MKSVYVDDTLHYKLKRLSHENGQTLISLLNRLLREGIEGMEQGQHPQPQSIQHDLVGMFGQKIDKPESKVEIEQTYAAMRYQGLGEDDDRF